MVDQYESEKKAEGFDSFKENFPVFKWIEVPSIKKLLNNSLAGKRVIDLACGTGDSTRILADLGPDELVGVDLSAEMIRRAIEKHKVMPKYSNIKFFAQNCQQPLNQGEFDIVFSVHLLNYAFERSQLVDFYSTMYQATKSGGVCCGLFNSPFVHRSDLKPEQYRKYGLDYVRHEDDFTQDVKFYNKDEFLFSVTGCVWPASVHEECSRQVGFKSHEWIKPSLDESYQDTDGFFDLYLNVNPTVMFKLTK